MSRRKSDRLELNQALEESKRELEQNSANGNHDGFEEGAEFATEDSSPKTEPSHHEMQIQSAGEAKRADKKQKRRTIFDDDNNEDEEFGDDETSDKESAIETIQGGTQIPRKSESSIPKKKAKPTSEPENSQGPGPSRLTQYMQAATVPTPSLQKPQARLSRKPPATGAPTTSRSPSVEQLSPPPPLPASSENKGRLETMRARLQAQVEASKKSMTSRGVSDVEQKLLNSLDRLCERYQNSFPQPVYTPVNPYGSFLPEDDRIDFFDKNKAGEIEIQPQRPMFPEEFPPGMKEHSLAWWGILDPALGDGKYQAEEAGITNHTASQPPPQMLSQPWNRPSHAAPPPRFRDHLPPINGPHHPTVTGQLPPRRYKKNNGRYHR